MKEAALIKVIEEIRMGNAPKYPCGICSPPKYAHYYGYCDDCTALAIYKEKGKKCVCLNCKCH